MKINIQCRNKTAFISNKGFIVIKNGEVGYEYNNGNLDIVFEKEGCNKIEVVWGESNDTKKIYIFEIKAYNECNIMVQNAPTIDGVKVICNDQIINYKECNYNDI